MEVQEVKEQLKEIFRTVINNDKWITIHPNGKDEKGRPLLLKDGESPKEAIERTYGKKDNISKDYKENTSHYGKKEHQEEIISLYEGLKNPNKSEARKKEDRELLEHHLKELNKYSDTSGIHLSDEETKRENKIKEIKKELNKKQSDTKDKQSDKESDSKDDELVNVTEDYYNRISEDELKKEFKDIQKEFAKWKDKKNFPEYKDYKNKLLKIKDIYEKRFGKQSDSKGDLDIKKTTVKMKSGKEREIEYVDKVPEGYKKLEGAMTAPLGYTWYHNGKSIIDKERKTILVKDKVNNSKEQDMALLEELKKLITKVENNKENEMEIENEKADKRDIIRQIMAIAGKEEASEDVKTIAKLAEKLAYDKSEAGTADNKKVKNEDEEKADNKKCKNEDEEDKEKVKEIEEDIKEDVYNKKVKNSKEESCFEKINAIYNSVKQIQNESKYTSRQDKLDAAKEYFS